MKEDNKEKKEKLQMLVEIPLYDRYKYEFDPVKNKLVLDRVLFFSNYPTNYGCLWEEKDEEKTINFDGDPLDVMCIGEPLKHDTIIPVRVLGVLKMVDTGERDDKLLVVNDVDRKLDHLQDVQDINKYIKLEIETFFNNARQPGIDKLIVIEKWGDKNEGYEVLNNCRRLYQKYKNYIGKIPKKELVKLLKQEEENN